MTEPAPSSTPDGETGVAITTQLPQSVANQLLEHARVFEVPAAEIVVLAVRAFLGNGSAVTNLIKQRAQAEGMYLSTFMDNGEPRVALQMSTQKLVHPVVDREKAAAFMAKYYPTAEQLRDHGSKLIYKI